MNYWVYMLRCCDESFYIGVTNDLKMRLQQHYLGFKEGCYTYKRLPVKLVYQREFQYILDAIRWEKRIKRWSRAKKMALIRDDTNELRELSHSPNQPELQRWQPVHPWDMECCHPELDEG